MISTPPIGVGAQLHHTAVIRMTALALALLTFAIYLPALDNGFLVNYDDNLYITENTHIRTLGIEFFHWALFDYKTNMWHPLTWLSHAMDYAVWGMKPYGHHLTSIILHAINTAVVFLLSLQFLELAEAGKKFRKTTTLAAGVTALLFGIHPLHVESVVWVTERRDLLYSLFFMLSIIWYFRFAQSSPTRGGSWQFMTGRAYLASLFLYSCSLASKPMAVTLPLILLLLDWYPLGRMSGRQEIMQLLREKLPFIAMTLPVILLTILGQTQVNAIRNLGEAPFAMRPLVAAKSVMLYLYNVIAPMDLLPLYLYPKDLSLARPDYLAGMAIVTIITIFCVLQRQRPYFATAWLFFIVTLLPVIGILQIGIQSMANRYIYLSSLSVFLLAGAGITRAWETSSSTVRRTGIILGLLLYAAWLSLVSVRYIGAWKDSISLFQYTLDKDKNHDPYLHVYLASAYERSGTPEKAPGEFDKAFTEIATLLTARPDMLRMYVVRGDLCMLTGNFEQAIRDYRTACDKGLKAGCNKAMFPF